MTLLQIEEQFIHSLGKTTRKRRIFGVLLHIDNKEFTVDCLVLHTK